MSDEERREFYEGDVLVMRGAEYRVERVDHIKPLSEGGRPYDLDNLKTLCRTCHRGKHFN